MQKFISTILISFVIAISGAYHVRHSHINPAGSHDRYVVRHKCKYQYDCGFTSKTNYFYMRKK